MRGARAGRRLCAPTYHVLSDVGRGGRPALPGLFLEHLQERGGERRPVLAGERDELARERWPEVADRRAQSRRDDVAGDDRDAEYGSGEVTGGGDLAGLDRPAGREARADADFEDQL